MQTTQTKAVPKSQSAKKKALASPPMSQEQLLQQTVEASQRIRPGEGQCASCGVAIDAGITWCEFCDPTPVTEPGEEPPKPMSQWTDDEWEAKMQSARKQVQQETGELPVLDGKYLNPRNIQEDPENERGPVTRETDPELDDLADNIKERGVIEPLIVYRAGDAFVLVSGHRRRAASILAGLALVPCIVRPRPKGPLDQAVDRLSANIHRRDLTPIEKARTLKALLDGNAITQVSLAERLGVSQGEIGNLLRILELPQPVQDLVAAGKITKGHAVALASIKEPQLDWQGKETESVEQSIVRQATWAAQNGLTVRDVEERCRSHNQAAVRNRQYAEEERQRQAERQAAEAEAAKAAKEGTLSEYEAALKKHNADLADWYALVNKRHDARGKIFVSVAQAALDKALKEGYAAGAQKRFELAKLGAAVWAHNPYNNHLKPDGVLQWKDEGSLLKGLARVCLKVLRYERYGTNNLYYWGRDLQGPVIDAIAEKIGLKAALDAAYKAANLLGDPPKPEPPKQEEPAEELAIAS